MNGVDCDVHPYFTVYSAGNFGEVAPSRVSPFSWSLIGPPMEAGTRAMVRAMFGRTAWSEGSHFAFVGYHGCRLYHNLSAYCHIASNVAGLDPRDVTRAYFEDVTPPPRLPGFDVAGWVKAAAPARMLRELARTTPRLRALEAEVGELEADLDDALADGDDGDLRNALTRGLHLLPEAWGVHILTTATLVPLAVYQRRIVDRLVPRATDILPWLNRPAELPWTRLYESRRPGDFLSAPFYEVADTLDPWSGYALRPGVAQHDTDGDPGWRGTERADSVIGVGPAGLDMVGGARRRVVDSTATAIGETMAAREHSKSLAMRLLHLFRRAVPPLADELHLGPDEWPYLAADELLEGRRRRAALERIDDRRKACSAALAEPMPDHLDLSAGSAPATVVAPPRRTRGVAPGTASGPVRSTTDHDLLDAILVCESADADIAGLLPLVAGVLSERGSEFSHIAILSREFGIPCVVGFDGAAALARDQPLTIDGTTGRVTFDD